MDDLECKTGNFIVVEHLRLCPWSFTIKSLRYSGTDPITHLYMSTATFINDAVMSFQPVKLQEKGCYIVKF